MVSWKERKRRSIQWAIYIMPVTGSQGWRVLLGQLAGKYPLIVAAIKPKFSARKFGKLRA